MESGSQRHTSIGLWLVVGLTLALALLALLVSALVGLVPWPVLIGVWLLTNALIPLLTARPRRGAGAHRRNAHAVRFGQPAPSLARR